MISGFEKKQANYGVWPSPIKAEDIAEDVYKFHDVVMDGEDIYFIESRPSENGRYVIMKQSPNSHAIDVLPAGFSARTLVHEYGGGSFTVHKGIIYFSNFADQSLYKIIPNQSPEKINTPSNMRFAQYKMTSYGLIGICEEHIQLESDCTKVKNYIALINPDTSEVCKLVSGNDFYAFATVNDDATKMAWITWNHPNMSWSNNELWVGDLTEYGIENAQQVDSDYKEQSFYQPQWSPRNELIVSSDKNNWWNLYKVEKNGNLTVLFEVQEEIGEAVWYLNSSSWSFYKDGILCSLKLGTIQIQDQSLLYLYKDNTLTRLQTPKNFNNFSMINVCGDTIACVASSASKPTAILRINADIQQCNYNVIRSEFAKPFTLDINYISTPQHISFESKNGRKAHAYLYLPTNKEYKGHDNQKPPLIVMSHGGPTANSGCSFDIEKQYWTSRGFAIVDVNYGGSTGYGREYRKLLDGQWGIVDREDCEAAALFLVKCGMVDKNKLAITGRSAGGYTTLAALTFTKTFHVGASDYGVSDCAALAQETHKFESRYLDRLIGMYPHDKAKYDARSPLVHYKNLNSPVIFFQGLEDKIVPANQAQCMHHALKEKGIDTELFLYEGEQHGFRKKESKISVLENKLRFFKKVLKLDHEPDLIIHNNKLYNPMYRTQMVHSKLEKGDKPTENNESQIKYN